MDQTIPGQPKDLKTKILCFFARRNPRLSTNSVKLMFVFCDSQPNVAKRRRYEAAQKGWNIYVYIYSVEYIDKNDSKHDLM